MRFFLDSLLISFIIIAIWFSAKYLYKRYYGGKKPYLFAGISSVEKKENGIQRINFVVRKDDILNISLVGDNASTKSLLTNRNFEPGTYHLDLNPEDLKVYNKLIFKSLDSYAERKL